MDFKTLRVFLSKEMGMKLIIADCGLGDETDFRVFIFSEKAAAKKKVKDRYIKIMTEKYDFIHGQYAVRLMEMLNRIYD